MMKKSSETIRLKIPSIFKNHETPALMIAMISDNMILIRVLIALSLNGIYFYLKFLVAFS
jgi:hypothetical protein